MNDFIKAVHNAAHASAAYMQADLRHSAIEHGWHPTVAGALHVNYEDGKFNIQVNEEHYNAAHVHEYGDEHTRPTATVRKYGNDTTEAERAFAISLERQLRHLL